MFIGRDKELKKLTKMYDSGKFECAVVYGRRRVGKTTLINEFCKGKKSIYFVGIESTIQNNLDNLSKSILSLTMPNVKTVPSFDKFDKALDYLYDYIGDERLILVIDEYPYLASSDRSISSVLQAYIDHKFKNSKLFLILCGSSMSFMENQVLGYQSPLYGRRTAQFKIRPFDYYDSSCFYGDFSKTDTAVIYGITGGIPQYLERIDAHKSLRDNIIDNFFDDTAYMFEEPGNLLKQELREPQVYNGIITTIARGASKLNEIATSTGLLTSICSVYLKSLISLGIVKKEIPITDEKSKKSIYSLEDNMFNFWYRFVPENIVGIIAGNSEGIYDRAVAPMLNDYMGRIFEQMCIEYLNRQNSAGVLPFMYLNIGRWWGSDQRKKTQVEIDIVAVSQQEKKVIFGECKYRNELLGIDVLNSLIEKSELFSSAYTEKHYILFSKSGFTTSVIEKANNNENIQLVDLDGMYELKI